MATKYIVVFDEEIPPEKVSDIEESPFIVDGYELAPHVLLVRSNVESPEMVGVITGLSGGESSKVGVVLQLNGSYHGYHQKSLWEWLGEDAE